ncbi:hypothetical protein [Enterococcus olivae]
MNGLTIVFILFTIILYIYLILLRQELVFVAMRKSPFSIVVPIIGAVVMASFYIFAETLEDKIRGVFGALLLLSYLFNVRGIAENRFVLQSLDNRGIKFFEVDRVVLFHDTKEKVVKLNFFRRGLRGPLMKFSEPIEEIVNFLSSNLKEGTPIDVIVNQSSHKN